MDASIRRFDSDISLPEYKTEGAAAMDTYVREDITIPARGVGYAKLNFALKIPKGHVTLLAARSSLHKRGLMMANGIGVLDEDYCGDNDEYMAILYNFTDEPVEVKRGERVAQIMIVPVDRVALHEVDSLNAPDRGGLGTTGI